MKTSANVGQLCTITDACNSHRIYVWGIEHELVNQCLIVVEILKGGYVKLFSQELGDYIEMHSSDLRPMSEV